jgi:hypothetical protein
MMLTAIACFGALFSGSVADANAYREKGKAVKVGKSAVTVTPPRDWNRLDTKPGPDAEVWTLDGEQLNDVTFYVAVPAGKPLVKERNKKRDPLPRLRSATLLAEVPELLENTYRAYHNIAKFQLTSSKPERFLQRDGVHFTYEYTDGDNLPRKGEARAILLSGKLYMMTFDAPRLHYFDRTVPDFRALAETATLTG